MKTFKTTATLLALALMASGPLHAQERDRGDGPDRGDMRRDEPRRDDAPRPPPPRRPVRGEEARGAGPDHAFKRGARLPDAYRDKRYYVSDWRSHHLSAPPRGYQWVQTGADFVLVAAATGIISQILFGQ